MTTPTAPPGTDAVGFSPPPPPPADEIQIKDFTIREKRIPFSIDGDRFEAYALLGLPMLQELVVVARSVGEMVKDQKYDAMLDIFDKVLYPESAKRFRERAEALGDEAIDVKRQLMPILYFLLEKYGLRPTQPSSDSSTGSSSETGGTSSTGGTSLQVDVSSAS